MTLQKDWPFQVAIFDLLETAFPGVPGYTSIPTDAPDRYWRLDAFTVSPERYAKNKKRAQHAFTLHFIDSPDAGTKSLKWVKEASATADAALDDYRFDAESDALFCESTNSRLEPRGDNVSDAHSFLRYTSNINGD